MEQNNNNSNGVHEMGEQNGGSGGGEMGVIPVDSAILTITDPSMTTLRIDSTVTEDGCPIKQDNINILRRKVMKKYWCDLIAAAVRNLLCWASLISLIALLVMAEPLTALNIPKITAALVIFCIGLIGVGIHATQAYYDLTMKDPTCVGQMLWSCLTREDFERRMQFRQLSAPEIQLEVRMRSGTMSQTGPSHWTKRGSKTMHDVAYRGWADQSTSVRSLEFPPGGAAWLIVSKDYRFVDRDSMLSFNAEEAEFHKEIGYDVNSFYLDYEIILQFKEAFSCRDVEFYLVFDEGPALLYHHYFYKACWFLAVDSLYRLIFHFNTKKLSDYFVIKYIER